MRFIKYVHPAALGYDPSKSYLLDDILKAMTIEDIKVFFEPICFTWVEVEPKKAVKEV